MCIYQDSRGFIWLGTKGGLSRFDGLEFQNYTINEGLANNFIYSISEDKNANIIIISRGGFSYIAEGKIYNLYCNLKNFKYEHIVYYYKDKKQTWKFLCFSDSSFYLINYKNGSFSYDENINRKLKTIKFNERPIILSCNQISENDSILFAANNNELYAFKNGSISKRLKTKSKIKLAFKGDDNQIYLYINDTIYKYLNYQLYFHALRKKETNEAYENLKIDKNGKFYYIDSQKHLHIGDYIDYYKSSSFNRLFFDKENVLWLWGETGLYKLQSRLFVNYLPEKCGIGENIWCISEDKNKNLYFGSYEGELTKLKNGIFEKVNLLKKAKPYPRFLHFYMGITRDKEKNIYFPMQELYKFDGNEFLKLETEKIANEYASLFTYIDSNNNKIYAGTNLGLLIKENNKTGKFYKIYPGNVKGRNIVSILKDNSGRLWLGGFKNISILDGKKIIHFPNKEYPFKYGGNAMYKDYKGNIWIGNENGLFVYDYKTFKKIENPYFNSITGFITAIDEKHLLIGNMNQLGVFFLENYYFTKKPYIKLYDKYNGFGGSECGQNGFFRDSDGRFWIIASDRVVRFESAIKSINQLIPNLMINELSIIDKSLHKNIISRKLNTANKIKLEHYQKDIRIDYLAINSTAPERVKYKYFLEGYDKEWSEITKERYAVYTNLSPGNYTFYLHACNEDNIWTDIPQTFSFTINKAFWHSIWFYIIIIAFVILLSALITRMILIRKKRKQIDKMTAEKKMTELQLNSLKGQIDPHFTFNAINSVFSVIHKGDKENALSILRRFSTLLRVVITTSSSTYRTIEDELEFVNTYLEIEKFRFKEKFNYKIFVDKSIDIQTNIPKMIIQTHVENAIKHGLMHKEKGGELKISINQAVDEILITIEDNGIGRVKAAELSQYSTGMGIKIINSYIELFNKYNSEKMSQQIVDLHDYKNNPNGTIVIIKIPLNYKFTI